VNKNLIFVLVCSAPLSFSVPSLADQAVESVRMDTSSSYDSGGSSGMANSAMMSQLAGAGSNLATGMQMQAICKSSTPPNMMACAMAKASYVQAGIMLASAFMSGQTRNAATGIPDFSVPLPDVLPGFGDIGVNTPEELTNAISTGNYEMDSLGYTYDEATGKFSTPEGKVIDDMSMAGIAAATGASAGDMSMASSALAKLNEENAKKFDPNSVKPNIIGMGFESMGGGSRSGRSGGSDLNFYKLMRRGPASAKAEQVIAGKSRLLGGESIGVQVDNLFDMVHRRYQTKRKSNTFIEK